MSTKWVGNGTVARQFETCNVVGWGGKDFNQRSEVHRKAGCAVRQGRWTRLTDDGVQVNSALRLPTRTSSEAR